MNYRKVLAVVLLIVVHVSTLISSNLRRKNKREEDSVDHCYRKPLNFTVTKVDKSNFTCKGLISTWSCRGYCETYEHGSQNFPNTAGRQSVCALNESRIVVYSLPDCDASFSANARKVRYVEAVSCACQKNSCQLPSLDEENTLLKKLGLQNSDTYSRFTKCTSSVLKSARASVEKCTASKLTGFTLPPILEPKDEPMKQPIINYWSAQIFVLSRNTSICPNKSESLDTCVADTIARAEFAEAKSSFNNFLKTEKTVDDFCNANCFSRLSNSECPNLLNTTYATLCNCVAEDFGRNFPSYGDRIRSCYINRQDTENDTTNRSPHPRDLSQFQIKTPASSNGLEAEGLRIQLQTEMCQQAPLNSCDKPFYELVKKIYDVSADFKKTSKFF